MSTMGERLKEERERLGMTIPVFAEKAGAKKNTVIDWQKDVSSPPVAKLTSLAAEGLDVIYIITGVRSIDIEDVTPGAVEATRLVEPNSDGPVTKALAESVTKIKQTTAARADDVSDINKILNGLGDADFEILKQVIVRFYKGSVN